MNKALKEDYIELQCLNRECRKRTKMKLQDALQYSGWDYPKCSCHKSSVENDDQSFSKFVKFYSRIRSFDEERNHLSINRFISLAGEPRFGVEFTCLCCNQTFFLFFNQIRALSQSPSRFFCPHCRAKNAPTSTLRELFSSLRWVIQLSELAGCWAIHFSVFELGGKPLRVLRETDSTSTSLI